MEDTQNLRRSLRISERNERQVNHHGQILQRSSSEDSSREGSDEAKIDERSEEDQSAASEGMTHVSQSRSREDQIQLLKDSVAALRTDLANMEIRRANEEALRVNEMDNINTKFSNVEHNFNQVIGQLGEILHLPEEMRENFDKLWDYAGKTVERIEAGEHFSRQLGEHLEEKVADASKKLEDSVTMHREQLEDRLDVIHDEFRHTVQEHNKELKKGMEILRSQVEDLKKSKQNEHIAGAAASFHPFSNRNQQPRTPATSVFRRGLDTSGDFFSFEDIGEDFLATPEERRDDLDRRNSLGGGSIFNAILAPLEPSNTYMISSVTRESYSHVVLRDITLDSVGPFMNHYLNIKRKHPGQSWMIVDFCSEFTKQELTVLADTYELPGTTLGLGGAFSLTDRQVLFLILEKLKARSMDDFVTRLQGIRFFEDDTDLDYTKQQNYDKLFRAALSFRFRFVMRVQLLGSRARAEHIPPLHKMGQTPGLLTYFSMHGQLGQVNLCFLDILRLK